jgi:hypothetical protein
MTNRTNSSNPTRDITKSPLNKNSKNKMRKEINIIKDMHHLEKYIAET